MQETANDINKIKRKSLRVTCETSRLNRLYLTGDQLQRDIRSWLSPPDPSGDHNGARRYYHDGTATWFTHGSIFEGWKTTGTLLWIHGKRKCSPTFTLALADVCLLYYFVAGSGKTVLWYV
jgi:hypothetical protein